MGLELDESETSHRLARLLFGRIRRIWENERSDTEAAAHATLVDAGMWFRAAGGWNDWRDRDAKWFARLEARSSQTPEMAKELLASVRKHNLTVMAQQQRSSMPDQETARKRPAL